MTIQFFGASGGVTGSMTLLSHNGFNLLIDAGQFQGSPRKKLKTLKNSFKMSDILHLTDARPYLQSFRKNPPLVKRGYSGKILYAPPTSHPQKYCSRTLVKFTKPKLLGKIKGENVLMPCYRTSLYRRRCRRIFSISISHPIRARSH